MNPVQRLPRLPNQIDEAAFKQNVSERPMAWRAVRFGGF